MVYTAFRLGLVAILLASDAFAQSDSSVDDTSEQKTARGMKITTGITWDSPQEDDSEMQKDSLNFKPRTQVSSLAELDRFLTAQLKKDEMSVVVSFFEPDQITERTDAYLSYLSAGSIPQNAMMAFALCSSFEVAGALKIPPPLPRTVQFSPKPDSPGYYEMRQAKFFQDGSVFLDGVLPVLATVVSATLEDQSPFDGVTGVEFPSSAREAVLGSSAESYAAATRDGEL